MALLVNTDPFYLGRRTSLLCCRSFTEHKLPAIYSLREHAAAGGLISYGSNLMAVARLVNLSAGFKGPKVAEMRLSSRPGFEMVINLKTAKALGLTITLTMLARSDEVIE